MRNNDATADLVNVALLYQTSQLEGHLKTALHELGAAVVYEALTAEVDRDALEGSGAHVVIVNLDPEVEAHLDEVYDLLDDSRYNVVFNDAQVSSLLSGWDQARWSRHLAAKILGRPGMIDPPRPVGSEAPPSPTHKIAQSIPGAATMPAGVEYTPGPTAAMPFGGEGELSTALDALLAHADDATGPQRLTPRQADPGDIIKPTLEVPAAAQDDFASSIESLVAGIAPSARPVPPPPQRVADNADFAASLDALLDDIPSAAIAGAATSDDAFNTDLSSAFDLAPNIPSVSVSRERAEPRPAEPPADEGFNFAGELDALFEQPGTSAPTTSIDTAAGSFAAELDSLFLDAPSASPTANDISFGADDIALSSEIAELASGVPGTRALPSTDELEELSSLDGDFPAIFDDLDAAPTGRGAAKPSATPRKPVSGAFENWSLDPVDDGDAPASPAPAVPEVSKSPTYGVQKVAAEDFLSGGNWSLEDVVDGAAASTPPPPAIEKIAAESYLAPEGGDAKKFDFDTSLKLDLVPLEESVSPQSRNELVAEHFLDESTVTRGAAGIRNVVVLGASIGGPEAVREFLSGFPARFPALFVLAQHMGAEFLDLMASQLAKATPLTIRTPAHGERVGHGEVVVVPTAHRLLIDAEGVVQLAHLPEASPYSPSIDLVLRDVADRFGAATIGIVFSGMAHDAIEGSKHLAAKGGKVWVQDPDSCVISSMVDGAREAGVVTFVGAPAELAKQLIAQLGKA